MWRRQEKEESNNNQRKREKERKKKKKEDPAFPRRRRLPGGQSTPVLTEEKLEQKLRTPTNGVTAAATGGEGTESGEAAGRISGQPEAGERE